MDINHEKRRNCIFQKCERKSKYIANAVTATFYLFFLVTFQANPAMKSAVKTVRTKKFWGICLKLFCNISLQVKDGGKGVKSAYKGLRSRLRESQVPQQLQNGLESPNDKPRSAPNSPTGKRRSLGALATYRKDPLTFKNAVSERSVHSYVMSRMQQEKS